MKNNTSEIKVGDIVVTGSGIGGPAMRVVGFGTARLGICVGATARLGSLRRDDQDPANSAWTAEFLVSELHVLPPGHPGTQPPYYDFATRA